MNVNQPTCVKSDQLTIVSDLPQPPAYSSSSESPAHSSDDSLSQPSTDSYTDPAKLRVGGEKRDSSWCYTMLTTLAACYLLLTLLLSLLPQVVHLVVDSSQQTPESLTSVPSDGPSTIYQSAKPATPFFSSDSPVHDAYNGALLPAAHAMETHGYVFVMYYAAWSANSMLAREEFEAAAHIMKGRVPFVAVQCWYESSQCRTKYKFYSFPSFYFYASGMETGFAYTGVEKAYFFTRFIESLLNPITHIFNSSQLDSFLANQESSLVGYFNLSNQEPAAKFQQFYYASLRSIEKDFIQPVRFGVLSDEAFASQYSINKDQNLVLLRSIQENVVYPREDNFTSTAITSWIRRYHTQPLVKWFFPRARKSVELLNRLQTGPTILLLTPYDACSAYNHDVSLLREIVLDYYSCNSASKFKEKLTSIINSSIELRQSASPAACLLCNKSIELDDRCCYSLNVNTRRCQICDGGACTGNCNTCERVSPEFVSISARSRLCFSLKPSIASSFVSEVCCHCSSRRMTDDFVSKHKNCQPLQFNKHSTDHFNLRLSNDSAMCRYNVTPNFMAVDSHLYRTFLTRFGIADNEPARSRLALIELSQESYYLMEGAYNKSNIIKFLEGFGKGNFVRERQQARVTSPSLRTREPGYSLTFSVKSITAAQLEGILSTPRNKDVVVMFYSQWCLHCKATNHIFLSSVKYLSRLTSITFFRLDVSTSTLSWKHAVHHIPTLTVFPHRGIEESIYQVESVQHLLTFILTRCSTEHLLELSTKAVQSNSMSAFLPLIRSRITRLDRELACLTSSGDESQALKRAIRVIKQNQLSLRKLYLAIYRGQVHQMTSLYLSLLGRFNQLKIR